jgi:hypothetical protein
MFVGRAKDERFLVLLWVDVQNELSQHRPVERLGDHPSVEGVDVEVELIGSLFLSKGLGLPIEDEDFFVGRAQPLFMPRAMDPGERGACAYFGARWYTRHGSPRSSCSWVTDGRSPRSLTTTEPPDAPRGADALSGGPPSRRRRPASPARARGEAGRPICRNRSCSDGGDRETPTAGRCHFRRQRGPTSRGA